LSRYPVKSMLGEQLREVDVDQRGVAGDRLWSVRTADGKIGSGKSTRRFAAVIGLLDLRARYDERGAVIRLPDGSEVVAGDPKAAQLISAHVGCPVTLAQETEVSHYDDGPISLLGLGSVAAVTEARGEVVEPARFRSNLLLDTTAAYREEQWVGRDVRIGTAVLRVAMRSPRCVMVNMSTADLPEQPGNLALLGRLTDGHLGVIASVLQPGRIAVGDEVQAL
jgi:uncharacterized protein YcbX